MRSRALMQDVIRYLEGMDLRQQPVLAGVVENVTDIRKWEHWTPGAPGSSSSATGPG
jgi:DNA (cytosine-5)-methyltransferase 1